MIDLEKIRSILDGCSKEERHEMFRVLRKEFDIHELEKKLNVKAEVMLEAISRASDLTLRGIRGIIAEASFKESILFPFLGSSWTDVPIVGDQSYDFHIKDALGDVRIQVKMQRKKNHVPMLANQANRMFNGSKKFVVETQRTRGGLRSGQKTRPYHYGDFDILAVSLHPSSGDWSKFFYTLERRLIPSPSAPDEIYKYQPVSLIVDTEWTDDLDACIDWLRGRIKKTITP